MPDTTELPSRIKPHLALGAVNDPLPLWSGSTSVDWGKGLEQCPTSLSYSWVEQAVAFELTYPHPEITIGHRDAASADGLRFKGAWCGSHSADAVTLIKGFAWDIHQVGNGETDVVAVQFLLPNMPSDFSTESACSELKPGELQWVTRLVLEADGWRVTVDGLPQGHTLSEELAAVRGWAITHVGRVERASGESFNVKEANDVLNGLSLFLSFIRGQRVVAMFPVGYDKQGIALWRDFKPARIERWGFGATWQREPGKVAKSAFPGFLRHYCRSDRRNSVNLAVEWFLQSNSQERGVDASIVGVFTGLDLMSWNLIVDDARLISQQGFEKLPGTDRLRLLLKTLHLNFDIPTEYQDLKAFSKAELCDILALVRNSLVHPTFKNRKKISVLSGLGKRQLWLVAMRVFELAILLWWECSSDTFDFTWNDWGAAPWR